MTEPQRDIARSQPARLADRAEIIDLVSAYTLSLDEGRFDDVWARSFFAEEAALTFPVGAHKGLPGLADFTARIMGNWAGTHHHATDHLVVPDGDCANVRWNMLATHLHPGTAGRKARFRLGGRVDGTAVRRPGGWRFASLRLRVIWTSGDPAPGVHPSEPTFSSDLAQ